ncbi:MAG: radical SAM protein [Paludibacteraceae bacterium]|nr:radical SAM protein [Paludibacteraceae bacterium]MBR1480850.1 radical SAM protein [Paludibacteraceae bacterium]
MLFPEIIYGPIRSRRLGRSLGVNLMPVDAKLCTFDCVYCECGWNTAVPHPVLPTAAQVRQALEDKLISLSGPMADGKCPNGNCLDVITFSGNGEPTLHPDFLTIIRDTCALRDRYCPTAKVSVLSNSTQLGRPDVVEALRLCDNRILKLDSAIDETMRLIDRPVNKALTVSQVEAWLRLFDGDFTLQTCFLRGTHDGHVIDNTTAEERAAYYRLVDRLRPQQLMLYVIDRVTPCPTLCKLSAEEMADIARPLREKGYNVIVTA